MQYFRRRTILLAMILIWGGVTFFILLKMPQKAFGDEMPVRPPTPVRPGNPPRSPLEVPESTGVPINQPQNVAVNSSSAYIELLVQAQDKNSSKYAAVVQWKGASDDWYDVDGWRSQLTPHMRVRWWVAPKDRKTGPFRWMIYSLTGNLPEEIWHSVEFWLPSDGETVVVTD